MIEGIVKGFKSMKGVVMGAGIAIIAYIIVLIVVGVFANNVADGTIDVPSGTNTSVQAAATSLGTIGTAVLGAMTSMTGFIVIGVLLVLFGGWLGFKTYESKKGRRY